MRHRLAAAVILAVAAPAAMADPAILPAREPVPARTIEYACGGYDRTTADDEGFSQGYCAGYVAAAIQIGIERNMICLPDSVDMPGAIRAAETEMRAHHAAVATKTGLEIVVTALSARYGCQR